MYVVPVDEVGEAGEAGDTCVLVVELEALSCATVVGVESGVLEDAVAVDEVGEAGDVCALVVELKALSCATEVEVEPDVPWLDVLVGVSEAVSKVDDEDAIIVLVVKYILEAMEEEEIVNRDEEGADVDDNVYVVHCA